MATTPSDSDKPSNSDGSTNSDRSMSNGSAANSGSPPERDAIVDPVQLRRATLAASVGSALEYYDFFIYGLASALIFGPLFFSGLGSAGAALIASFATYAVGFCARPLGGIIFGRLGDIYGRKVILLTTIALMGLGTFAIGLLPTYASIGVWAPIILVALRIIQGLGAGAEQAGATTLISEFAPRRRRGFFAALPFVGIQLGTLLGAGVFALLATTNRGILHGWLWRVPFLASVVLIAVAIFIRLRLRETPIFQAMEENKTVVKNPLGQLWRTSKWTVLKGIGLRMGENGNSSIYQTLALSFIAGLNIYDHKGSIGTTGVMIGAALACFTVVFFGAVSDRAGRVIVYRYGALFQAVIALPAFYLITLGQVWLVWIVMAIGIGIGVQSLLGPQCAMFPELFGATHRYSGVAISREFSAVIAGGIAPLVGAAMLEATNYAWWTIGGYSMLLGLISFVTTFFTAEIRGRDLDLTTDAQPAG